MTEKFSNNANSDTVIWIDLDNSPHVPFFAPIIKQLESKGYKIAISVRKYSQTVKLSELYGLRYSIIGKHNGKHKLIKLIGLVYRAIQLAPFAMKKKPLVAISHGSRAQMIIARILNIPIIMFLDYEYIQTIPFVKPKVIFLPNIISSNKLKAVSEQVVGYPGIKEDIYVPGFIPNKDSLSFLNRDYESIQVLLRPPAYEAHYHNPESEILFERTINFLTKHDKVQTVILPRDAKQKDIIYESYKEYFTNDKLIIPREVVDGLNLIWYSDLVISGGGTMNREAAALGVPVYSIFRGKIGDVDKYLAKSNRLIIIKNTEEIEDKIKLIKRVKRNVVDNINSLALQTVVQNIEKFINNIEDNKIENRIKIEKNADIDSKRRKAN